MKLVLTERNNFKWYLLFILLFALKKESYGQNSDLVKISDNQVIWNQAKHNAFTTLESFSGDLYCAFREGASHKSYDGKIRIIKSKDGKKWESVSLIASENEDLRDPKLIVNEGKLLLLIVSRTKTEHFSYTYSSLSGTEWSLLEKSKDTWRWNAAKNGNTVYSMGYSGNDKAGNLYKTTDGKEWISLSNNVFPDVKYLPNETKLFFTDNRMIALVRQERGNQSAILGISDYPYTSWNWKDLGIRIGSPAGILLNREEVLICVRLYGPGRTSFVKINIENGNHTEIIALPSGGDTGYADIVKHEGEYWVSYYSSKNAEKKASVYLAKFNIHQE